MIPRLFLFPRYSALQLKETKTKKPHKGNARSRSRARSSDPSVHPHPAGIPPSTPREMAALTYNLPFGLAVASLALLSLLLFKRVLPSKLHCLPLPPGPIGWPIIGNGLDLPEDKLFEWAAKQARIYGMCLVVCTFYQTTKLFLVYRRPHIRQCTWQTSTFRRKVL